MKLTRKQKQLILNYVEYIDKHNLHESNWTCHFVRYKLGEKFANEYIKLFKSSNLELAGHWLHYQLGLDDYTFHTGTILLNEVRMNMLLTFMELYK